MYIPPLVVPVNRVRVSCDIVHLSFPGPKDVRNPALSKRETESKDIRKSGTYKACRMMRSFSETVPICLEITIFPSPSLMYLGFVCCSERNADL